MARRSTLRTYQTASRIWMTAALLSLLLPADARLGLWLPLHLALAGAVSVAIAGAMQNFALTLSAAPDAPPPVVWTQFVAVNLGALLIAVGYPVERGWLVAIGGAVFVIAAALLGWLVARARRVGLNRRHAFAFAMYGCAIAAVIVGGALGSLAGSRVVEDPETWLALRSTHLSLNVLGWASLTIAGTLVTFLPTVLRIRMPAWHGAATGSMLVAGVAVVAVGVAIDLEPLAILGAMSFAAGTFGLAWMAVRAFRMPRTWPVPTAAKHLVCALAWLVLGAITLPWIVQDGLVRSRETFLAIFVAGWVLQTLLGAWQYLVPMARPGHPDERRAWLSAVEFGGFPQVLAYNLGVALLALDRAGIAGRLGAVLAIAGAAMALGKAWAFAWLARLPAVTARHGGIWGA